MSGRSAFTREKKSQVAEGHPSNHQRQPYYHNVFQNYGYQEASDFQATPTIIRRLSFDSEPSSSNPAHPFSSLEPSVYGWPTAPQHSRAYVYRPPMAKQTPRPIVIASAIERSDFRTHLDGLTDNVRERLGRLVTFRGSSNKSDKKGKRPGTASSNNKRTSISLTTPSIGAVPSLVPDDVSQPGHLRQRHGHVVRSSSSQHSRNGSVVQQAPKILVFHGGSGGATGSPNPWQPANDAPELMDYNGDTLVTLYTNGLTFKPATTFRINSRVLVDAGCTAYTKQLRDMPATAPNHCQQDMYSADGVLSAPECSSSEEGSYPRQNHSRALASSESLERRHAAYAHDDSKPPARVQYRLRLNYLGDHTSMDADSWLFTTRNFFAVLYGAGSLCGRTLFEALRLLSVMIRTQAEQLHESTDRTAFMLDFLQRFKFDDVRSSAGNSASILAFSELPDVRWRQGYAESFVHCVGLLSAGMATAAEWKLIPARSRIFIENAAMDLEGRLRRAQSLLADFSFQALWPSRISSTRSCARGAFDRFRIWLCEYCASRTPGGVWPPAPASQNGIWLTRERLIMLRDLFDSLFDYLVDHDIIFDRSEYSSGDRDSDRWSIVSRSGQFFRADPSADLPVTGMLLGFDDAHGFDHMPNPYPIRPEPVVCASGSGAGSSTSTATLSNGGANSGRRKTVAKQPSLNRLESEAHMQHKALSYVEASNLYTATALSDIIADFNNLERSDMIETINPRDARLGRWLLVYAALQALSAIAVDTPGLRYRENTPYHLNCSLRGVVPWAVSGEGSEPILTHDPEPKPNMSHPFRAPRDWPLSAPRARTGTHKPIVWGAYGDGRERADEVLQQQAARERAAALKQQQQQQLQPKLRVTTGLPLPTPTSSSNSQVTSVSAGGLPSASSTPALATASSASSAPLPPTPQSPGIPRLPEIGMLLLGRNPKSTAAAVAKEPKSATAAGSGGSSLYRVDSRTWRHQAGGRGGLVIVDKEVTVSVTDNRNQNGGHNNNNSGDTEGPVAAAGLVAAVDSEELERQRQIQKRLEEEQEAERVRKRRAEVHGFTNYRPEAGW